MYTRTEKAYWAWMRQEAGLTETKKTRIMPRLCERSVRQVNSPSHAYAMQKAKAPGSVFNPREEREKMWWGREQCRTQWGWERLEGATSGHIYSFLANNDDSELMRQNSQLTSVTHWSNSFRACWTNHLPQKTLNAQWNLVLCIWAALIIMRCACVDIQK